MSYTHTHLYKAFVAAVCSSPPLLSVLTPPPILLPLAPSTRTLRPLFSAVWGNKRGGGGGEEEGRTGKEGKKGGKEMEEYREVGTGRMGGGLKSS